MRNSRRGGVGFTLTDDRRVFAGPPKPPFLLLRSRLDSPLLINGALLRHDVPVMFIGCSVVTELFGCTFTDRSGGKKKQPTFYTDRRPPSSLSVTPELQFEGSVLQQEKKSESRTERQSSEVLKLSSVCLSVRTEEVCWELHSSDAQRGFHTAPHCCCSQPLHGTEGSAQNLQG